MTYSTLQIEIIKLLGSKELSFGCLIKSPEHESIQKYINNWDWMYLVEWKWSQDCWHPELCEIIGHLPSSEDLFIKAEEKGIIVRIWSNESTIYWFIGKNETTFRIPYNPKLKPYQQTEETMNQILTLFK